MRITALLAWTALIGLSALPAAAGDVGDAVAGLPVAAETRVAFTPGVPLLTRESQNSLAGMLPKASHATCYWIAQGRTLTQAEALRAGIGEMDVAVERIIVLVRVDLPASARVYCTPPARIAVGFQPGAATLMPEAEAMLPLVLASYGGSDQMLSIRGYASPHEAADPTALAIDRANAARDFLIGAGLPAERMTIEGEKEDAANAVPRVEITLQP